MKIEELIKHMKLIDPRPYTPLFASTAYAAWQAEYLCRSYPETETTWKPIKKIDFNKSAVFTATSDKPINMEMLGFETNQTAISLGTEELKNVENELFNGL